MTPRETFGSRLAVLATMVGLAVGLGNVWRFPYMVGQFGGATFILLYLGIAALVAVLLGLGTRYVMWAVPTSMVVALLRRVVVTAPKWSSSTAPSRQRRSIDECQCHK